MAHAEAVNASWHPALGAPIPEVPQWRNPRLRISAVVTGDFVFVVTVPEADGEGAVMLPQSVMSF